MLMTPIAISDHCQIFLEHIVSLEFIEFDRVLVISLADGNQHFIEDEDNLIGEFLWQIPIDLIEAKNLQELRNGNFKYKSEKGLYDF